MIPKFIFQTYEPEIEDLPKYLLHNLNTWKDKNPDWEVKYFSASDREMFVKNNYDNDIYKLYKALPISIMKKDFWQYLVVNKMGGLYVDMDSVCLKPLSETLDLSKSFIVSTQDRIMFWMWIFLSEPDSKILNMIIEEISNRYEKNLRSQSHYVANTTGPAMFSDVMWKALGILDGRIELVKSVNELTAAKEMNLYCYGYDNDNVFDGIIVNNLDGRNMWAAHGYPNWELDAEKLK